MSNRKRFFLPDPTCELNVAKNRPVLPHQSLTFLSKEAEAKNRASGEKAMWLTACWCPIKIIKKSLIEKYILIKAIMNFMRSKEEQKSNE